jgi:hypothetical protein
MLKMENNIKSFKTRFLKCKVDLFSILTEKGKITLYDGSRNKGYYDLEEISIYLNPLLLENEIDYNISVLKDHVVMDVSDNLSEQRIIFKIDLTSLEGMEKLSLMKNKVQSLGAIVTYMRRYIMNMAFNIPVGDQIDGSSSSSGSSSGSKDLTSDQKKINDIVEKTIAKTIHPNPLKEFSKFGSFDGYDKVNSISEKACKVLLSKVSKDKSKELILIASDKNVDSDRIQQLLKTVYNTDLENMSKLVYDIVYDYILRK